MEAERTLAHARFQVEGAARNSLILCDLGGRPPRRVDDDDLTLGASASPTTTIAIPASTSAEKTGLERSFISYDTTTATDYSSYSSPLIKHDTGEYSVLSLFLYSVSGLRVWSQFSFLLYFPSNIKFESINYGIQRFELRTGLTHPLRLLRFGFHW